MRPICGPIQLRVGIHQEKIFFISSFHFLSIYKPVSHEDKGGDAVKDGHHEVRHSQVH